MSTTSQESKRGGQSWEVVAGDFEGPEPRWPFLVVLSLFDWHFWGFREIAVDILVEFSGIGAFCVLDRWRKSVISHIQCLDIGLW